jgi:hypothetical protein
MEPLASWYSPCNATGRLRPLTAWLGVLSVAATIGASACSSDEQRLVQHQAKLESLVASTEMLGQAWLGGRVSNAYAKAALEQLFTLADEERSALARLPQLPIDARGGQLSHTAERLSRLLAGLMQAVRAGNAAAVERQLHAMPTRGADHR